MYGMIKLPFQGGGGRLHVFNTEALPLIVYKLPLRGEEIMKKLNSMSASKPIDTRNIGFDVREKI